MTWHTLDGRKLTDLELADKFRRLAREIGAREAEAEATHKPSGYTWRDVVIPSPRLKPFIAKIAADMKDAQVAEDELQG